MAIKLPNCSLKKKFRSAPNTPVGRAPKPQRLQPLSPLCLEQCCSGHCSRQPGPFVREPGAILAPRGAGFGPLHGKPRACELGPPLDIRQVAALIGCSPWTVRQTLMPRGLPYFRSAASGRLIFYTHQIVGWIESQQFQGGY
jgi:hypothetical protein